MGALSENLIHTISKRRCEPDWLLQWRLDAFRAWTKMTEPHWGKIDYQPIDYDELNYYNEPSKIDNSDLENIYDKMGLPESEKKFDREMAMNTLKLLQKLGYDIVKREK